MEKPVQRWQIGDVTVTKVVELEMTSSITWIVPDATRERLALETWLQPHFADAEGRGIMSIHGLVIEARGRRILVDTCIGNDKERAIPGWSRRQGPFLSDLAAAGHAADSIDTVLCTHLHVDHVGWNTRLVGGRWVPTFGAARYLFHRREYDHWERERDDRYGDVFGDSVAPVVEAGQADFVDEDHQVCEEVQLVPTPGHTPGHVSVRIRSCGEEAIITGDLMHHPVQVAHPEWGSSADVEPDRALTTRRDFVEQHAERPVLVLGTHFAGPTAGRVVRAGGGLRFAV